MNIGLNPLHCTIVLVSFKFYNVFRQRTQKDHEGNTTYFFTRKGFSFCFLLRLVKLEAHILYCYKSIIFSWSSGSWVQISSRTHNAHPYLSVKWIRIKWLRLISFAPTSKAQKSARFLTSPALKNKYLIDEGKLNQLPWFAWARFGILQLMDNEKEKKLAKISSCKIL